MTFDDRATERMWEYFRKSPANKNSFENALRIGEADMRDRGMLQTSFGWRDSDGVICTVGNKHPVNISHDFLCTAIHHPNTEKQETPMKLHFTNEWLKAKIEQDGEDFPETVP